MVAGKLALGVGLLCSLLSSTTARPIFGGKNKKVVSDIPDPKTYWYEQVLDHFNPRDTRTFQERYLVYDEYYIQASNAPIFFYAGNEGDIEEFYYNTGFMFDIAPAFGALIIFAEHRYYGETIPLGDDSFKPENMAWLTIENAVADYAVLLTDLKVSYNAEKSPVVVFGGSYGGCLAAACRIHYPSVFDMALAASAPIPQTLNMVDPYIFFKLVTEDYENADSQCPDLVRQAYVAIRDAAAKGDYKTLKKTFNLCNDVTDAADVEYLELWARNGLLTMAMVDYPYAASFLGSLPAWPVKASCNLMLDNANDPMAALAAGAGLFYNASNDYSLTCFDMRAEFIECADQTGCGLGNDAIAWDYQECTELVYGIDTNNESDMFPPRVWELSNLTEYCQKTYQVTPVPERMQIWFPLDVGDTGVGKIIFSNGELDPWHGGGYITSPGPDMPTVIIPSGAHHIDLRSSNPEDPADVIEARQKEVEILSGWINDYYRDMGVEDKSKSGAARLTRERNFRAKRFV